MVRKMKSGNSFHGINGLKNLLSRCYIGLIVLFLYAPILVLIVLSFNQSRSRVTWGGFTLDWYGRLFSNQQIMDALVTTLVLAFFSALIATVIGVVSACGGFIYGTWGNREVNPERRTSRRCIYIYFDV